MKDKKRIPILKGFVDGKNIVVWCPFCQALHRHGFLPSEIKRAQYRRYGFHKTAHCLGNPDSPFRETGYFVKPYTQKDLRHVGIGRKTA